jgi:hypothetical protein
MTRRVFIAFVASAWTVAVVGRAAPPLEEPSEELEETSEEPEEIVSTITYSNNRIALDVDGNQHDRDDWAATPLILALLARRNLQSRMVHYDYNNHLGDNSPYMASQMTRSTLGGADRFGFNRSRFFNAQTNLSGAINSLKNRINASSAANPLFVIAAGPMELLWQAVNAADAVKRPYVTIISHSVWNDTHADTSQMHHTKSDVLALGVQWVQIINQNSRLHTKSDWLPWSWLQTASDSRLRWVYNRMRVVGKADVSDAGMVYYLLTNDQSTTPGKLRQFFGE